MTVTVDPHVEIRVDAEALAVTMRTPGEDEELAAGFLASEGLLAGREDIEALGPTPDLAANVVDVRTRSGLRRDPADERRFYMTSSCGICGKGALEFVERHSPPAATGCPIEPEHVLRLPDRARGGQPGFERTGGLHATAVFEPGGRMLLLRDDVGRHNAMEKALGALLLGGRWPLAGLLACLSGRQGSSSFRRQRGGAGRRRSGRRAVKPGGAARLGARHAAVRLRPREFVQRLRGRRSAGRLSSFHVSRLPGRAITTAFTRAGEECPRQHAKNARLATPTAPTATY